MLPVENDNRCMNLLGISDKVLHNLWKIDNALDFKELLEILVYEFIGILK
jgi:hypothetical protein